MLNDLSNDASRGQGPAALPQAGPPTSVGKTLLAPRWHTALLAAAVLSGSLLGLYMRAHTATLAAHHIREYLLTLGWEWALAAAVMWGLFLRRVPMRALLGAWPQGWKAWLEDAGVALVFWIVIAVVLGAIGVLLKLAHLKLPDATIAAIAPGNVGELLLFLALSVSAGFCEELLFRGYFQQQFFCMASGNTRAKLWIGVAASSLLFGFAHLYEGAAGVISITVFGGLFSLLALKRRSLRPGMMAHAWHDGLSGVLLFFLQRSHMLS